MKLTTDFIRAAVEGKTADGREITGLQIQQMAASYNPEVYNARIWPEHIRGVMPDGLFKALGDVVQVKAEAVKDGALKNKMALYVKIEPHPDLITMVRSGQKVHLSIEMQDNFPSANGTHGAYLVGLGVTDSPASLGTGLMHFSTQNRTESRFSEPVELVQLTKPDLLNLELPPDLQGFNSLMEHFKTELADVRTERDQLREQLNTIKAQVQQQLSTEKAQFQQQLTTEREQFNQQLAAKDDEIESLKQQIPADGYQFRPKFTGLEGNLEGVGKGWR